MNAVTEEIVIEQTTYTLRTRLGWLEQQRIDQAGFQLFADGKSISAANNLDDIEGVEIRIDTAQQNLMRLTARLDGKKASEVKQINPRHIPILLARIAELEAEESAEIKALSDEYPLTKAQTPTN